MPSPQPALIPEPTPHALFLVLRVRDAFAQGRDVARILAGMPALVQEIACDDPRAKLLCNVAFGPELWDVISPGKRPAGLRPFQALAGPRLHAPATGGDVLIHATSRRRDLLFALGREVMHRLGERVEVAEEVHGFRYQDSRDLTGFIDGTENPKGRERAPAALVGKEDHDFAGGSYVFTQRYVHNLERWATLTVEEQERVIGRRKPDSEELPDDIRPPTAHISRVVIEEDGEELQVVRHSFPYGTMSEAGLFFIAYCRTLDIPERMLRRMMGVEPDGLHDHLMESTQAVSGAHFFAPSREMLASLGS